MNSTKTLFLTALAAGSLLAFSPAATADDTNAPAMTPPAGAPPPGARGGMRGGPSLEQLSQQLNLTDDQKPKVKAVLDERDKKMQALRDSNPTPEDRRTKMQTIRQETTDAMKGVLTPEQFDKYQQMAQRAGNRNRPGGPGGTPPGGAPATPPAAPPQN